MKTQLIIIALLSLFKYSNAVAQVNAMDVKYKYAIVAKPLTLLNPDSFIGIGFQMKNEYNNTAAMLHLGYHPDVNYLEVDLPFFEKEKFNFKKYGVNINLEMKKYFSKNYFIGADLTFKYLATKYQSFANEFNNSNTQSLKDYYYIKNKFSVSAIIGARVRMNDNFYYEISTNWGLANRILASNEPFVTSFFNNGITDNNSTEIVPHFGFVNKFIIYLNR
jgi:hypothetical protein